MNGIDITDLDPRLAADILSKGREAAKTLDPGCMTFQIPFMCDGNCGLPKDYAGSLIHIAEFDRKGNLLRILS